MAVCVVAVPRRGQSWLGLVALAELVLGAVASESELLGRRGERLVCWDRVCHNLLSAILKYLFLLVLKRAVGLRKQVLLLLRCRSLYRSQRVEVFVVLDEAPILVDVL